MSKEMIFGAQKRKVDAIQAQTCISQWASNLVYRLGDRKENPFKKEKIFSKRRVWKGFSLLWTQITVRRGQMEKSEKDRKQIEDKSKTKCKFKNASCMHGA